MCEVSLCLIAEETEQGDSQQNSYQCLFLIGHLGAHEFDIKFILYNVFNIFS